MSGKVCERHQEWCPDGKCRWCEPTPENVSPIMQSARDISWLRWISPATRAQADKDVEKVARIFTAAHGGHQPAPNGDYCNRCGCSGMAIMSGAPCHTAPAPNLIAGEDM